MQLRLSALLFVTFLFAPFAAAQSTTLSALTGNNTAACGAAGAPSYCQAGFSAMSDTASGTYNPTPGNVSTVDVHNLLYPGATTGMLAFYQPWFCMNSGSTVTGTGTLCSKHVQVGYNSDDSATVNGQLNDMIQRGFNGTVVDYYGTNQTIAPGFDATTQKVRDNLAGRCTGQTCPLYFALMEDDGGFKFNECPYNGNGTDQTQCLLTALEGDLDYMNTTYFGSNAYLRVDNTTQQISSNGRPVVLFFICEACYTNPAPNWTSIWSQVAAHTNSYGSAAPFLYQIFQSAGGLSHVQSNGAFAWVNWFGGIPNDPYGLKYLDNFYASAESAVSGNSELITIGGGWKGFDETNSPFGNNPPRVSLQQCGNTWLQTFQQAAINGYGVSEQLPFAGTVSWNDYDEGTEIETGIDNCLSLSGSVSGTVLSWSLNFSSSSGSENTVHHYVFYDSADGQNLTQLATFPQGMHSVDLKTFTLSPGTHQMYVQAVGQPSILNHVSNEITYTIGPLSVSTTSLPSGTQNVAYSATLTASGGVPGYTWSIVSGSLPSGLTLNASTGAITGVPTTTGTSNFTVKVADSNSQSATKALSITINSNSVAVGLAQENAAMGTSVVSLPVSFGAANTQGNLIIAFVRMSTTTQTVSVTDSLGNVYADAVSQTQSSDGHQVHIFYAKNIKGGTNRVTATFSSTNNHPWLAVYEYSGLSATSPLDQTAHAQGSSAAPTSGATGTTANASELVFAATGLPSSYTGTANIGSGYTLLQQNTSTSRAADEAQVATTTGTFNGTFSLRSSANWSAVVATFAAPSSGPALSVTTTSLPSGTQNVAYSATLAASGGSGGYAWSIISGSLPAGLALNASTGAISGTPTGTGVSSFTVQVKDSSNNTATQALSITINGPALAITTTSLPSGTQSVAYSATLAASGGSGGYTWSVLSGNLPAGLALNASTGAISGTPTGTGVSSFTAQVKDSSNNTATQALSITVNGPALAITTTSLPNGTQNVAYSATLVASGGSGGYTWSVISGSLPAGLALNAGTGAISGTPTGTGVSSFTVQVKDSSNNTATKALSITINGPALAITTTSLPSGTQNVAYSATLAASGGSGGYTWSVLSGSLPAGLALNASTGAISGTPTGTGVSSFTVQVKDSSNNTATQALSITINGPALAITTTSLPSGTQNVAYSATLAASGGSGGYTWSVLSGSLPAGLALNASTGAISGTPTGTGVSSFTVQVKDSSNNTATQALSITINGPALAITTTSLPSGTQNVVYSATLAASGGSGGYTWSVLSGSLPAGLALNASTGAISGMPTGTGVSSFTVQVKDSSNNTATKALSITVNSASSGIALLQSGSAQGSGVSSVSTAFTANNTSGNLIIAFVRMSTTTQTVSVGDTAGNVYADAVNQAQTVDGHETHIFYASKIKGGANTVTATFSGTNNHPFIAIYEYQGVGTLDQTARAQGSSSAPNSGSTATTTAANELLFSGLGLPSSSTGTVSAGAGFKLEQQLTVAGGSRAASEDGAVATTGSFAGSFAVSSSANWTCLIATFK